MGEVDQLDDPVDHRVAEGDERVDRSDRQRVERLLDRHRQRARDRQALEQDEVDPEDQGVDEDPADAEADPTHGATGGPHGSGLHRDRGQLTLPW
jgi:hypothetical protein